jgi:hypothetical protein
MADAFGRLTGPEMAKERVESYDRLRAEGMLVELSFHSSVPLLGPLIAWFREQWNSISTKWYVRSLIHQQNRFNASLVDQLAADSARLDDQMARLSDREEKIGDCAARMETCEAQLQDLWARLRDHDTWLIDQDHEQSAYVRDLAEVTLQLIQLRREFGELNDRLSCPGVPESRENADGQ